MIIRNFEYHLPFQDDEEEHFLCTLTHNHETRLIRVFLDGKQVSTNETSFLSRVQSALYPYEDQYTKEIKRYLSESDFVGAEAYLQARKAVIPQQTKNVMQEYGFEIR